MKFFQFKRENSAVVALGVEYKGKCYDMSHLAPDMREWIQARRAKAEELETFLERAEKYELQLKRGSYSICAPIYNPKAVWCVGLNYVDHCAEQGLEQPKEPLIFSKGPNAIVGQGDKIVIPKIGQDVDLEAELAIIIGRNGKNITKDEALDHVFGYTVANDVSERTWQIKRNGGQFLLGKSFDTFLPLGPMIETQIDPGNLKISGWIDDVKMQDSNTSNLIFDVPAIIAWISQFVTLTAGDVIITGTPGGVGMSRTPPVYLKPGNTTRIEIEGLGSLENPVVAEQ